MNLKTLITLALAATVATALMGCNTTPVQDGAVFGGALGAGTGAILGHQVGKQGEGALIGAGLGALTGALVGDQIDKAGRQPAPQATAYRSAAPVASGHYETRIVRTPSGETYEERVWVYDR
ncbi:MAG: glycine zipper domain-containing protein [Candidatus Hydrogenedentales bacterium]|jgi:uncharacterized protein YcfJ